MVEFSFKKYQGTGNDFVMINGIDKAIVLTSTQIASICERRFGVGADGLIIIKKSDTADFYCDYYNADGTQSFCGNGARCAVMFSYNEGIIKGKQTTFDAIDGIHEASIENSEVSLKMLDVHAIDHDGEAYVIDTGSPHYISFQSLSAIDIYEFGKRIRYSDRYKGEGINVNVAEKANNGLRMLTYERGVENETYSCGTGATAVALAYMHANDMISGEIPITVKGGQLHIKAVKTNETWQNIYLIGPATYVYEGKWEVLGLK